MHAYLDLVSREYDCYATWLPGTKVAVGEIGYLSQGGAFIRSGDLHERAHYTPPTRVEREPPQTISTQTGVVFSTRAAVGAGQVLGVLADVGAQLDVTFHSADAAAMVLQRITRIEVVDERPVRDLMRHLAQQGTLGEHEVVVTWVLSAESGVVMSTHSNASAGHGALTAQIGPGSVRIANVDGHLTVITTTGSQTLAQAAPGVPLTPMYRVLVLRRNRQWWSFWRSHLEPRPGVPVQRMGTEGSDDIIGGSFSAALAAIVADEAGDARLP